jgi:hypothetical protein
VPILTICSYKIYNKNYEYHENTTIIFIPDRLIPIDRMQFKIGISSAEVVSGIACASNDGTNWKLLGKERAAAN